MICAIRSLALCILIFLVLILNELFDGAVIKNRKSDPVPKGSIFFFLKTSCYIN